MEKKLEEELKYPDWDFTKNCDNEVWDDEQCDICWSFVECFLPKVVEAVGNYDFQEGLGGPGSDKVKFIKKQIRLLKECVTY